MLLTQVPRGGSAPPSPVVSAPRLGPWQLVLLVGEGEWTRVYRARPADCSPNAPCDYAVKVLRPDRADDPVAVGLLRREAQVAREVSHPHLVSILSAHVARPPYFVAMPCLEGVPLRTILSQQSPLGVSHALWIARQIAEALQALHDAGWSHGDVKPSNVMVSALGHATLIDLGFAQRLEPQDAPVNELPRDMLAGTPDYLAPELLDDTAATRRATAKSDVFSLGATLFEMLTGSRIHRELPNDPRRLIPALRPGVARLVVKMLSDTASDRPCARELVSHLYNQEIAAFADGRVAVG